jgi:FAD/FMN-containing dehydrogenase
VSTTADPAAPLAADLAALRAAMDGEVHTPADEGFDAARMAWNVAVDQRPAMVAVPASPRDVAEVVRFAHAQGLRVAVQGTGHNAAPRRDLLGSVLLRTSAMTGVRVDPVARTVRAEAGALWGDVVEAAAPHGLVALHGSSPDVGVVGYTLGGGIGWLARRHGLASGAVTAIELVTPDGRALRVDAATEPEMFWALRGGGGNFGVVTAIEMRLLPLAEVTAGWLVWPWEDASRVLNTWSEWTETAPDAVTSIARILQLPPIPEIPEPLRGRNLVVVEVAVLHDEVDPDALLAPLRALGPEMDTVAVMPAAGLCRLHQDPEGPTPGIGDHAMLDGLPAEAVATLVELAGPGSGSPLLSVELRQLGGALGRPDPDGGALSHLDGRFALFAVGIPMDAAMGAAVAAHADRLVRALAPWGRGRAYLNFSERPVDAGDAFDAAALARLRALRASADPADLMHANHVVPGA